MSTISVEVSNYSTIILMNDESLADYCIATVFSSSPPTSIVWPTVFEGVRVFYSLMEHGKQPPAHFVWY
jgi:hypothetical protein